MRYGREPNYLYLTIGLLAAVVLATSAGGQVSFAIIGVLLAGITFMVTAWFVIESKRQFVLVGALAITALLPFIWLVRQTEEQFPGLIERLYLLNLTIWLLFTADIAIVVFHSIMSAKRIRANEIYGDLCVSAHRRDLCRALPAAAGSESRRAFFRSGAISRAPDD